MVVLEKSQDSCQWEPEIRKYQSDLYDKTNSIRTSYKISHLFPVRLCLLL